MHNAWEVVNENTVKVQHNYIGYGVMALILLGGVIVKDIPGTRGIMPEPFDIINHIGNVNISAQGGYWMGLLAASKYANHSPRGGTARKARAVASLAGLSVGLVLNTLVETKTGQRIINWDNTADIIDFYYGIGGATLAAALLPRFKNTNESDSAPLDPQPIDDYNFTDESGISSSPRPFDWQIDVPPLLFDWRRDVPELGKNVTQV